MNSTKPNTPAPGVICGGEVYTEKEFRRRMLLADYAFRQAKAAGLRVVAFGKKRYVRGIDWMEFLARQAESKPPNP